MHKSWKNFQPFIKVRDLGILTWKWDATVNSYEFIGGKRNLAVKWWPVFYEFGREKWCTVFINLIVVKLSIQINLCNQLGQGERSFKETLFSRPCEQTWLATHHWLSCSQLYSIPGPFTIDPSGNQTGNPPLHEKGKITKSSTRRTHCKLWVCFFGLEALMQAQEIHLPSTASPTSELSSKAVLPYAFITGYATIPPHQINLDILWMASADEQVCSSYQWINI